MLATMKILSDLQTRHMLTVKPENSLHHVARLMADRDVGSAVVVENGEIGGIVTERDLLRSAGEGRDFDKETVAAIMTRDVVTAEPGWDVLKAARTMTEGGFRHLLVVDADDSPVGIVSVRDLIDAMAELIQEAPA